MKPRARFIESARSDYREDERSRGRGGVGDFYHGTRGGHDGCYDDNVVVIDDKDDNDEVHGYDYGRAYAYGIGTLIAGLVVAVVVMGTVRWWMGGWDEGVEGRRFCFA